MKCIDCSGTNETDWKNIFACRHGLTLVELAVVIAILSIMATIAIPSFLSWIPNLNFRDASLNMLSDINLAKMTAMKRNAEVTVTFNTAGTSCSSLLSGTFPDSGGSYTITVDDGSGGDATVKSVSMPTHVAICASTFSGDLIFKQNGLPDLDATSTVSLINDVSKESNLSVNLTGYISMD